MTPKATGGNRVLRDRVSILFGFVFLIAATRWVIQGWLVGSSGALIFFDSRFWLVTLIGFFFFLGLRFRSLRFVEPYIFLIIAAIPFVQSPEIVYGFGLFAVGAILLLVDGQLSHRPLLKLSLLMLYFVVLLVGSVIVTRTKFGTALALLLFMTGFFLFLFLTFQDKIVVFVKMAKPVVRLSRKGLADKEIEHILLLLSGKSMKEIAWEQGVKESTIRNSLSRAYHKLGFTDKTQLLQWAETKDVRP